MKAALFLLATTAVSAEHELSPHRRMFDAWQKEHGLTYASPAEYETRLSYFRDNLEQIELMNAHHANIPGGATFGVNKFADRSKDELRSRLGFRTPSAELLSSMGPRRTVPVSGTAPASKDYRKSDGVVAPIQDQASCGSCWAFSAITNVESRLALATGKPLVKLSEQQLVDCDHVCGKYRDFNGCDSGCNGGLMPNAWTYLSTMLQNTSAEYPYKGRDGTCQTSARGKGAITGFDMLSTDEAQLVETLATEGPFSIAVDASTWSFYKGGIVSNSCRKTSFYDLNHGVAIVGYDSEAGVDYWIVRNSWGSSWGENGYMRIIRNTNQCGVALFACTVTIAK